MPRLVDALPNGPRGFATVQVFLAGGVPEVMLALRAAGLLDTSVKTVSGETLDACLDWWQHSERRHNAQRLKELDGIDADDVIMSPDRARSRGLTATVCFPVGNLAPEGSVIKSTAIDPSLIGEDNVYRHRGPARVFITEAAAIAAIKGGDCQGDVIVLICGGPAAQACRRFTRSLGAEALPHCKHVAVLTDARFSGVSTGACIGHISPEALAGGPIGKVLDGDLIEIVIDRDRLDGLGESCWRCTRGGLAPRKARADWAATAARPIWPHPRCRMIRACGRRWFRPAAASGVVVCTTQRRLWSRWDPGSREIEGRGIPIMTR